MDAGTEGRAPDIRIVTVSRQFGSGGSKLAGRLGALLGWRVVDRDVIHEVAERLSVDEEEVDAVDEQVPGLTERVGRYLADAFPEMLLPPPPLPVADEATVRITAEAVLREAAAREPVVLVGFGAQCIFADRSNALHLRVFAPLDFRVRVVAQRLQCDPAEARRIAIEKDGQRRAYLNRFYGCDIHDPGLYSLLVNTARVTPHEAAEMIATLVRTQDHH